MDIEVEINEKFMSSCGTGTLLAAVMKQAGDTKALSDVKKVTLVFWEKPLAWCQFNGGPHEYIITEYALPCLLNDVLRLQEFKIQVDMRVVERD